MVTTEEGVNIGRFRRIGVADFVDSGGRGGIISAGIENGLTQLMYAPVDLNSLRRILGKYKPDPDAGLGLEAMEDIREHTSADSILFGRMAPDWSMASIVLVDTNMGDQVLRAIVRPHDKMKKTFSTPEEVVQEVLRVLTQAR